MPSMHKAQGENKEKHFFYKSGLRHFDKTTARKAAMKERSPGRGRRDKGQGWAGRKNIENE